MMPENISQRDISIEDIVDFISTTDTVPDYTPQNFFEQFVIYKNGTTRRFYWYDTVNNEWVYTAGSV